MPRKGRDHSLPPPRTGSALLDRLKHETRFALRIATRDIAKRVAAFALICGVCLFGGATAGLWPLVVAVALSEVAALLLARRARRAGGRIGAPAALAMWAVNVGSTAVYLAPALLLAGAGTVALLLSGFLWIFGTLVHLSNTFIALPLYNRSQIVPAAAMALGAFWVASATDFARGPAVQWWVAAALTCVYVANTVQTIVAQKDTQAALDAARTEAAARLAALERMSRQDPLTGLLNRRAFDEILGSWLDRAEGVRVAVLVVDLDGFKPINDSYSHAAGDAVLVAVARRLAALTAGRGLAARLGGDEFIVALDAPASAEEAMDFAGRLLREIDRPIAHGERSLRITGSVGVAMADTRLSTVPALCAGADRAMFRAKAASGGRAELFDPALDHPRATVEDRGLLVAALAAGQFVPHYQPKVRLDSGAPVGFEALARWNHPERGLLLPGDFLPQVGDLGLQTDFQAAMARQVLSDVTALLAEGLDPGQVSINISESALATLSGRLDLDRIIAGHAEAIPHLTLEIAEDIFIARAGGMIRASIAHYRAAGLRLSLDDFGTGFASFRHLRRFEFDEMKIDRSFVADLGGPGTAGVLVEGFLAIARGLGIPAVAEGVETEEQRRILLRMGCDLGQGRLFGPARPFAGMRALLAARARPPPDAMPDAMPGPMPDTPADSMPDTPPAGPPLSRAGA